MTDDVRDPADPATPPASATPELPTTPEAPAVLARSAVPAATAAPAAAPPPPATSAAAPATAATALEPDRVHAMAPWGLRRARFVSTGIMAGGVIIAAAMVAMLGTTSSAAAGVALALVAIVMGLGVGVWVRRQATRVRLSMGDWGVRYEAPMVRIEAAWSDVAAVDQVLRGTETGPALVLTGDRMTSGRGVVGLVLLGGALEGSSVAGPSYRSTIPLAAFIEGRFVGSPVERDLRRFVPQLVDGFVLRHPDLVR